jgi:hypothetical protein
MEPAAYNPLTLNVAVFGEDSSNTNMILDKHCCGGRMKHDTSDGVRSVFSALQMSSPVGPFQVDFAVIDTDTFVDVDDDKTSFPEESKIFDMARKQANFFLFHHDWKKMISQELAIQCLKKCNKLFDKETPKAFIGTKAEGKKSQSYQILCSWWWTTAMWLSSISFRRCI